jgi:hypothetical protein
MAITIRNLLKCGLLATTQEEPNRRELQRMKWFCKLGNKSHETSIKPSHTRKSMNLFMGLDKWRIPSCLNWLRKDLDSLRRSSVSPEIVFWARWSFSKSRVTSDFSNFLNLTKCNFVNIQQTQGLTLYSFGNLNVYPATQRLALGSDSFLQTAGSVSRYTGMTVICLLLGWFTSYGNRKFIIVFTRAL